MPFRWSTSEQSFDPFIRWFEKGDEKGRKTTRVARRKRQAGWKPALPGRPVLGPRASSPPALNRMHAPKRDTVTGTIQFQKKSRGFAPGREEGGG